MYADQSHGLPDSKGYVGKSSDGQRALRELADYEITVHVVIEWQACLSLNVADRLSGTSANGSIPAGDSSVATNPRRRWRRHHLAAFGQTEGRRRSRMQGTDAPQRLHTLFPFPARGADPVDGPCEATHMAAALYFLPLT